MFNKPKKEQSIPTPSPSLRPETRPVRPQGSAAPSIIGSDIKITGNVSTPGELHLDGVIEGDVECGELTVGEHGIVTGTVKSETVTLRGTVEGKLRAKTVNLEQSAKVNGDVTYGTMTMEAGVQVDGKLIPMKKKLPPQKVIPGSTESKDTQKGLAASKPGGPGSNGKPGESKPSESKSFL